MGIGLYLEIVKEAFAKQIFNHKYNTEDIKIYLTPRGHHPYDSLPESCKYLVRKISNEEHKDSKEEDKRKVI